MATVLVFSSLAMQGVGWMLMAHRKHAAALRLFVVATVVALVGTALSLATLLGVE